MIERVVAERRAGTHLALIRRSGCRACRTSFRPEHGTSNTERGIAASSPILPIENPVLIPILTVEAQDLQTPHSNPDRGLNAAHRMAHPGGPVREDPSREATPGLRYAACRRTAMPKGPASSGFRVPLAAATRRRCRPEFLRARITPVERCRLEHVSPDESMKKLGPFVFNPGNGKTSSAAEMDAKAARRIRSLRRWPAFSAPSMRCGRADSAHRCSQGWRSASASCARYRASK